MPRRDPREYPAVQTSRLASDTIFNSGSVVFTPYDDDQGGESRFTSYVPIYSLAGLNFSSNGAGSNIKGTNEWITVTGRTCFNGEISTHATDLKINPRGNVDLCGKNIINVGEIITGSADTYTLKIPRTYVSSDDMVLAVLDITPNIVYGLDISVLVYSEDGTSQYIKHHTTVGAPTSTDEILITVVNDECVIELQEIIHAHLYTGEIKVTEMRI